MIDGMKISLNDADIEKLKKGTGTLVSLTYKNDMQLYKVYSNGVANKAYLLCYNTNNKTIVKTISLMNLSSDLNYNYDVTVDTTNIIHCWQMTIGENTFVYMFSAENNTLVLLKPNSNNATYYKNWKLPNGNSVNRVIAMGSKDKAIFVTSSNNLLYTVEPEKYVCQSYANLASK